MSRKRPYFPLHRITTGKYSKGGEYVLENGTEYIGPYHILPNGWVYTGFIPHSKSTDLYNINTILNHDSKYLELTDIKTNNYISPKYITPNPSLEDYNNGFFIRYFVQKRANPINSILEIDHDQATSINKINGPGINGTIWNSVHFNWLIRGTMQTIITGNQMTLYTAERQFKGISNYIKNLIEFIKF